MDTLPGAVPVYRELFEPQVEAGDAPGGDRLQRGCLIYDRLQLQGDEVVPAVLYDSGARDPGAGQKHRPRQGLFRQNVTDIPKPRELYVREAVLPGEEADVAVRLLRGIAVPVRLIFGRIPGEAAPFTEELRVCVVDMFHRSFQGELVHFTEPGLFLLEAFQAVLFIGKD